MINSDRRKPSLATLTVHSAVWLATQEGTAHALDYMLTQGIPEGVALRVLGGYEFRRRSEERRSRERNKEDGK